MANFWIYVWLAVIVLAVIVEFSTSEMVSVWFAGGGLIAMILAICSMQWYIQFIAFVVISLLLLAVFRKYVLKYLSKKEEKTNADAAINKDFTLLTPISFNQLGTIKVNDVTWNVKTENDFDEVKEGTVVTVKKIKGNKYIVEVKK